MSVDGRVLIAFVDDPLDPNPTWTRIDAPGGDFPDQFVSGFDAQNGKQALLAVTETGTGTVYINDHQYGLFDPRNSGSPYYQKLDAKQIMLQLYDPVRAVWEPQFRGQIDNVGYDIDASAVNANGEPVNASIQIDCVDKFEYLSGFGLTPGLAGDRPPTPGSDGVWYAPTTDELFVRIIQILADCGIDDGGTNVLYVTFSGNVALQTAKYDAGEAALTALRDCADADMPYIAQSLYVDRKGRIVFHGRYGRFDPDAVAAHAGSDRWDFHRWSLGDGKAVRDDGRTQMRVLSFDRARSNLVNNAICFPQGMNQDQMINQVFADVTSINDFGNYAAPPMSDLLTAKPWADNLNGHPDWDRNTECLKYAELIVKNMKDPREAITALQLKTVAPTDPRAADVWACMSQVDVNDIVNVKVGYPAGVGFTGGDPDDYFVEGRQMRVRPLAPGYDHVELDLHVSPAIWSQDTHGVFPDWPGGGTGPGDALAADFTAAE
jgi:hypothetical protein